MKVTKYSVLIKNTLVIFAGLPLLSLGMVRAVDADATATALQRQDSALLESVRANREYTPPDNGSPDSTDGSGTRT
ncbi:hypothetical protein IQ249_17830 [Lusitaniella coriacea LEGE 07157]|uniref:Uncharacterized protein n=2 Tax=Lusitaniella TaxID=1983104 RepID=A0A8J7E1I9_9CYAN|nr:hypothetical protein [Lusitaniella coriacea LEGE 07157]